LLETIKKHQLLENIKKYEFSQQSLGYLGYVIGIGEDRSCQDGGHHEIVSSY